MLVNNAGYGQIAPFEQMSTVDFQALVDTCFYGVVYTTRAAVPVMRKQKSGHIFQVSSVGGRIAVPGNTPYHAAKWAVGGFSDSLAMEVAPFGVKICTLEPGGIRTNWARRAGENMPDLLPEYEASVGAMHKILRGLEGRAEGDPRKIADVILQLANSDEVPVRLILGVDAEKRVKQKQKSRAQWKLKNADISLSQRCVKMGPSTADCIWQRAEPIPELLNPGRSTIMKYRLLGKSGLRVSEASLGTMTFGDEWGWGSPKAEAQKVYETYREAGGNFIDTANFYTTGTSEKFLGEFMQGHRESVVLATKYSNAAPGNDPNAAGNHRKNMMQAVEASLKRLQTDYIDLYWVHIWDGITPVEEVMRGLDDLVRQEQCGVLYVGISDAPHGGSPRQILWRSFEAGHTVYRVADRVQPD